MSHGPMEDAELDRLRRVYREGLPEGTAECPGDEELTELALGEIGGDRRQQLADHVAGCRRCADDFRTLLELRREAAPPATARRWPAWASVAAAAGVVLLLWIAPWGVEETSPPATPPADGERGAAPAIEPPDQARLAAPPRELRWPAEAGATTYRLRLHDASATVLWESPPLDRPEVTLPSELGAGLIPGSAYFWTVDVEGPASRKRLGPHWFHMVD